MIRTLLRGLCAPLLILTVAAPLCASVPVKLRVGEHAGFGRMVFEWPKTVGYEAQIVDGRLRVSFAEAAAFDLEALKRDLEGYVGTPKVSADGTSVDFPLRGQFSLEHFTLGSKVVLDLKPTGQAGSPAASPKPGTAAASKPPPKPQQSKPARETAKAEVERPSAKPSPQSQKGAAPEGSLPRPSAKPAPAKREANKEQAAPAKAVAGPTQLLPPSTRAETAGDGPAENPDAPRPARLRTDAQDPAPAGPASKAAAAVKPSSPSAVAEGEGRARADAQSAQVTRAGDKASTNAKRSSLGRAAASEQPVSLRFSWAAPTPAATFRRGDYVWLLFDRPARENLARSIAKVAPQLAPVTLDATEATIIRMTAAPRLTPKLKAEGNSWLFSLQVEKPGPARQATMVLNEKAEAPKVSVPLRGPGKVSALVDPEVGDLIYVVPVSLAGLGFARDHRFPQFRVLASHQGLVVQPFSDSVTVTLTSATAVIQAKDGLWLSSSKLRSKAKSTPPAATRTHRLFDLPGWRRGDLTTFNDTRQALQQAVAQAPKPAQSVARLDLARFFFAHGMGVEALGILSLIEDDSPRFVNDPQVILLKGASQFLSGKYPQASKTLEHLALNGEQEAALWRGAMAAVSKDWPYAAEQFAVSQELLADYPEKIATQLRLLTAEALIELGEGAEAGVQLAELRDLGADSVAEAQIELLEGRRLLLDGDDTAAEWHWTKAIEGPHAATRARARYLMLQQQLAAGTISTEEAIAELERLRFAWRGDLFEFTLLERLGELYVEIGEFRKGLLALRQAASHLSNAPGAPAVTERMREVFADLLMGESATRLTPIQAVAIFGEFQELTPTGQAGDKMIERLADRLVEVDLLEQAADVLEDQMSYRLEGVEKARIGLRLALVYVMDDHAGAALDALIRSEVEEELPEDLARQRRHLRARTVAEVDGYGPALDLLEGDESHAGRQLRAEFLWEMRAWRDYAEILYGLLEEDYDEDAPMVASKAQMVLSLALAHSMAGDRHALQQLDWQFGEEMAQTEHDSVFTLLTRDLDDGMITSIADELAGIKTIQTFMTSYREQLEDGGLSSIN